jgi:hypothetical protein
MHDVVDPTTTEEASKQVACAVRDIKQSDDDGREVVWLRRKRSLDGDVENVQTTERDASVVYREQYRWEAEPGENCEWLNEDLVKMCQE